jgi:hypothetical protein
VEDTAMSIYVLLVVQLMMKSVDGGKSYGKSSTDMAMLWMESCPEENKLKATLKIEVCCFTNKFKHFN